MIGNSPEGIAFEIRRAIFLFFLIFNGAFLAQGARICDKILVLMIFIFVCLMSRLGFKFFFIKFVEFTTNFFSMIFRMLCWTELILAFSPCIVLMILFHHAYILMSCLRLKLLTRSDWGRWHLQKAQKECYYCSYFLMRSYSSTMSRDGGAFLLSITFFDFINTLFK